MSEESTNPLNTNFEMAINIVNNLKKRPSDNELLEVYKFFKQAKFGDNNTPAPGMLSFAKSAKWSAWKSVNGMSQDEAMQNYIDLAMKLFNVYGK